jgi:carboxymethylenebutenolidase
MNSAVSLLNDNYFTTKIGSIGWCFGGGQSLNLALDNDDMDATVIYYGSLVTDTEKLSTIQWPVLGIFAGLDKGIPVDTVTEFESSLNELDIENHIYVYPDVDHAFANPSGERYAPEASKDAWIQTISFLESNLQ